MVRLFHVYYPVRALLLFAGETLLVIASFLCAVWLRLGSDSYLVLNYEDGIYKLGFVALLALLCSYYGDLYELKVFTSKSESYFRLLAVIGMFSTALALLTIIFPDLMMGKGILLFGIVILTLALILWREAYGWLLTRTFLRERVLIVGSGERAERLSRAIRTHSHLGMDLVGWATPDQDHNWDLSAALPDRKGRIALDRVILAMGDRRGRMPVRELLDIRLHGVKVEESAALLEKISGRLEVDDLYPSSLIFSEGFRLNEMFMAARRSVAIVCSLSVLLVALPLIPLVLLAIKLSSPGPVIFKQPRVGRNGKLFNVYKFRTMRQDAEAKTGAVWAVTNDPRVTTVGKFLRKTRLDEIPQLFNVLKGDMGFVGPRPERPEFVQSLTAVIPYYNLRHIIRPGVTGWAQVRYPYGASIEESKEKLKYDLYYIKHMSLSLDFMIAFETVKTVLLRRGSR
ncbi:MAG: TIGR03013 family PEP-CTERM/XrtA system glycosyltransferase [Acidobacteria bacterium]|nr:TIGR03013 family PEP-CTERM/XrtA system glycosyltransferase [Acidobacteriota bacterium]